MSERMKEVWLIRHGQSMTNAGLTVASTVENPLTEKGIAQSKCMVDAFDRAPSLVVTSPYIRTKQTAQPTLAHFAQAREEEWAVHEFTPISADKYAMPANERHAHRMAYWERCDPAHDDGDGAESFLDVMDRIRLFLERIKTVDEFAAIFTHGTFTRILLWHLLANAKEIDRPIMGRAWMFVNSFRIPNTAILKLAIDENGALSFRPIQTSHLPDSLLG